MRITNNAELRTFLKGFYDQHVTALNGLLDKLPENLRADLAKLRDGLNAELSKLPPLEQIPAAQDAAWAFSSFADAWQRMQEYSRGLLDKLETLRSELATKATALHGLEEQIARGGYLSKQKVTEACDLARAEGIKSLQPELRATRKSALELAGLPVPGESILDLPRPAEQGLRASRGGGQGTGGEAECSRSEAGRQGRCLGPAIGLAGRHGVRRPDDGS